MGELIGKWNYYVLRYGAGSVVGGLVVVFLGNQAEISGHSHFKHFLHKIGTGEITPVTALLALGFTYCYIASAPGTVFHAARGLFWKKPNKWLCPCWNVIFFWLVVCVFLSPYPYFCSAPIPFLNRDHVWYFWGAIILALIIFLLQVFLLIAMFYHRKMLRVFYVDLTRKRSKRENNIKNYVKSYRDLREHGNAFEIIIWEMILIAPLMYFKEFYAFVIVLWILPAALCWFIGTMLEFNIPRPFKD